MQVTEAAGARLKPSDYTLNQFVKDVATLKMAVIGSALVFRMK